MCSATESRRPCRMEWSRKPAIICHLISNSCINCVEQAVVYSTLPQEYSTLTFRGEVVAGGGGVEERSEVMYCIEGRTYIYYKRA